MKDKNGNIIQICDPVKVLWAYDKREYKGKVVDVKGNIALITALKYFVYINKLERLLKIPVQPSF